mmetsp:Transcript_15328/g.35325  ORF Transcript_15328/g.35325 Transcript_15328/m.35325 type:complete len:267 (+) Transcript_15328:785-1585(+)
MSHLLVAAETAVSTVRELFVLVDIVIASWSSCMSTAMTRLRRMKFERQRKKEKTIEDANWLPHVVAQLPNSVLSTHPITSLSAASSASDWQRGRASLNAAWYVWLPVARKSWMFSRASAMFSSKGSGLSGTICIVASMRGAQLSLVLMRNRVMRACPRFSKVACASNLLSSSIMSHRSILTGSDCALNSVMQIEPKSSTVRMPTMKKRRRRRAPRLPTAVRDLMRVRTSFCSPSSDLKIRNALRILKMRKMRSTRRMVGLRSREAP